MGDVDLFYEAHHVRGKRRPNDPEQPLENWLKNSIVMARERIEKTEATRLDTKLVIRYFFPEIISP